MFLYLGRVDYLGAVQVNVAFLCILPMTYTVDNKKKRFNLMCMTDWLEPLYLLKFKQY